MMRDEREGELPGPAKEPRAGASYQQAAETMRRRLIEQGLGSDVVQILARDEAAALWPAYVEQLRAHAESARFLPLNCQADVDAWLTARLRGVDSPCALFEPFEDAAVGISLAFEGVDGAALTGLATSGRDLMLSSFSGDGGLCVECNYVGRAQQYEFVSWGTFATE